MAFNRLYPDSPEQTIKGEFISRLSGNIEQAIQELQDQLDAQNNEITSLRRKVASLENT